MGALNGHGCAHPCAGHLYEDRCARPGCTRLQPRPAEPWPLSPVDRGWPEPRPSRWEPAQ